MAENILVSPLGRSPGAVSGLALALREPDPNVKIDRVVTVGTSHPDVVITSKRLEGLFNSAEVNMAYDHHQIPRPDLRDLDGSADAFVATMGLALEKANQLGNVVHVAVTGGRSGMGALTALATNLYGADYLWHFWVKDDIAEGGTIDKLGGELTLDNRFVNPIIEEGSCELVKLPFVDLRPLHPVIWDYHRNKKVPDTTSPFYELFATDKIKKLQQMFPSGMTIGQADQIVKIKQEYNDLPDNHKIERLLDVLTLANVADISTKNQIMRWVAGDLSPDKLLDLASTKPDKMGFWQWLRDHKTEVEIASAGANIGMFLFNAMGLWLKFSGYI